MGESRQRYNLEFKKQTVKYIQERSKTIPQIAEELNMPAGTLSKWLTKYREFPNEPFVGSGNLREEALRIKNLEEQNRDLQEEVEILKKLCTSSAKTGSEVPLYRGAPRQVTCREDVQSPESVPERILQVAQVSPE
ncbi:MAG: transposase [Alicyclobacillus sp.]|nr:transposase [Alicyclobacillus sp.]